jgi:regulator of protease activity HflC (stomatin/prohibitin superfamily)
VSSGFAWLNELMVWVGRLFPRLVLVKAGNRGVWFGPGGRTRYCEPGLHVYWPITSELTLVSVRQRTTEIASQLHGREIVSIAVVYTIRDPRHMLLCQNDVFAMVDDRAQAYLAQAYGADRLSTDIAVDVLLNMQSEFDQYGVHIQKVNVLQRGRVIPLKNLNDWAQHAKAELA